MCSVRALDPRDVPRDHRRVGEGYGRACRRHAGGSVGFVEFQEGVHPTGWPVGGYIGYDGDEGAGDGERRREGKRVTARTALTTLTNGGHRGNTG
jgi:hypothetical protein